MSPRALAAPLSIALAATVVLCVLAFIAGRMLDPDPGGYVDGFTTKANFPDKYVHFVSAAAIAYALALVFGPTIALAMTALAGLVYEIGQGYVSWYDWIADVLGALVMWIEYRIRLSA